MVLLVMALGSVAQARTWMVDAAGGADFVALQPAIDAAKPGDTVQVAAGTYVGALTWSGKDLAVVATDGAASTTIEGPGYGALLTLADLGAGARLEGFTLHNPGGTGISASNVRATFASLVLSSLGSEEAYGGAAYFSGGAPTLSGVELSDNQGYDGGALYADGAAALTLVDCVITGNGAANNGGAFHITGGASLDDTRGEWTDNAAYANGGDVYAEDGVSLSFSTSTFRDSTATYGYGGSIFAQSNVALTAVDAGWYTAFSYSNGGAVYLYYTQGTASFTNAVFEGCQALYGSGGAIYAYYYANVAIDGATFTEDEAAGQGGAILGIYYVDLDVQNAAFDRNMSDTSGGAIYYDAYGTGAGGVRILDSTFAGNVSAYEGGGASLGTGNVERIERSTFEGNLAGDDSFGGGLYVFGGIEVIGRNNTLRANSAGYGGGAYVTRNYSGAGHDLWTNNLFIENTARVGGGLCLVENGGSTVQNNTLVGNAASEEAGALCLVENPVDLRNNIFAETTSGTAVHAFDSVSVDTSTVKFNNLHGNIAGDTSGALPAALDGSNTTVDPGFVSYVADADDGDSFVLKPGSKLVDAGDPAILDADGTRSDVGAFGGPEAWVEDVDGDGVDRLHDCDDVDASVLPGATETWYDGVDQDCDGNDADQDGDGTASPDDCDDTDPDVQTCPRKHGEDPDTQGCACGASPRVAWAPLLLGAFALRRRR